MNTTTKTVILALMIMSATLLSGCITDAENEDEIIERMTRLEAILTDPEFSEDDEEMMAKAAAEMEAITGEKIDLRKQVDVISEPEAMPKYQVPTCLMESVYNHETGIGSCILVISDGLDFDKLEEVKVFINNETIDTYSPTAGERRKLESNSIGDWIIRVEGTFKDGTVLTLRDGKFNGIPDMSDLPDVGSRQGPFGERYIGPSGTSSEEAKRICEEHGVVWGDDRDIAPTPTATAKVTPTFSKATPTIAPTPEPELTLPSYYNLEAIVDRTQWNDNTLVLLLINGESGNWRSRHDTLHHLDYVEIYVDGQRIVSFEPTIVKGNTRMEIEECPMIINLPDGMVNSCEITMIGSFSGMELSTADDGDYIIPVYARTPPMRYEEEYSQFPVWNP